MKGKPPVRSKSLQSAYAFVLGLPKTTSICSWFLLLGFPDEMGLGERALENAYSIEGYPG